jgi:glycosyltransferase involved in cell wall biosynthesis
MCSEEKFKKLTDSGIIKKLPQAQKYHKLLAEGLRKNIDGQILALSSFPTNRRWTKKLFFKGYKENIKETIYRYPFFLNIPVLRQMCIFISSFIHSYLFLFMNKDSVAICDILTKSNTTGARLACRILGRKCIGIVTDVPGRTSGARRKTLPKHQQWILSLIEKNSSKTIDKYDAYLLLTEAMNEIVNPNNKPYIVLEGHADMNMSQVSNLMYDKYENTTILYSGGIHKEFGIEVLVKAFLNLDIKNCELHIYGDGNFKKELEDIAKKDVRLRYFGTVDNAKVIEAQTKAHLLVNPRLTYADYTKYSFPSKNMEYMASGTPMLTTRLPGMPPDYYDYVYIVDDETIDGFQKELTKLINQPKSILHKKGSEAKDFILENKNNIVQAGKLVRFIKNTFASDKNR